MSKVFSSVINENDARKILEPWMEMMRKNFRLAWDWVQEILSDDPERRATFPSSTVSAMVYDRFTRLVQPDFDGKRGVTIKKIGRMVLIRIDNKISLRFKRLDRRLRSGNVPTKTQKAIYHNANYLIDVTDRSTAITFGYVPGHGDHVRGLYFTCPKNFRANHWMIVVDDQAASAVLFTEPPTPVELPSMTPLIAAPKVEAND